MNRVWLMSMALLLTGCASMEKEVDVAVDDVPAAIVQAAQQALPGFRIESAELEMEDGEEVYELDGTSEGKRYELEISKSGEVLEIEEIEEE